jgi:holliday junction DNA helicase RuvA
MIASLRGVLTELQPGSCVIECDGVGYLVQVSAHTAQALPGAGEEVFVRTRQVVREDSVQLFGFADAAELKLFDLLIGVSGVGPKLAIAVLSGLRPDALSRAIRDEQVGALVAIQGIGRKTAERLIVDLRDKIEVVPGPARGAVVLPRSEQFDDAVAALVRLGYTSSQSQEAVRQAAAGGKDLTSEELVKRSLAALSRLSKTAALSR